MFDSGLFGVGGLGTQVTEWAGTALPLAMVLGSLAATWASTICVLRVIRHVAADASNNAEEIKELERQVINIRSLCDKDIRQTRRVALTLERLGAQVNELQASRALNVEY